MQWFRIVICHTPMSVTSSSRAEWDLFSSAVTAHTPALQTLQTKLGYTCIQCLPLPWWSLFARRRINQNHLKLSQLDSMIFVSSQGFWETSVLHHPKKRFNITLPLVSFKLRTQRINNLQADQSHFFNTQHKNSTCFSMTYCIRCNFNNETISASLLS